VAGTLIFNYPLSSYSDICAIFLAVTKGIHELEDAHVLLVFLIAEIITGTIPFSLTQPAFSFDAGLEYWAILSLGARRIG
jgi:hypothetical protein